MVQQNNFTKNANHFINNEAHFTNDYLLNKKIDSKEKTISLVFGGKEIDSSEIVQLNKKMDNYELGGASLEIKQGFAYLTENKKYSESDEQVKTLMQAMAIKENNEKALHLKLDSIKNQKLFATQVFNEIKAQYPVVENGIIQPVLIIGDSSKATPSTIVILKSPVNFSTVQKERLKNWLITRLGQQKIGLIIQR